MFYVLVILGYRGGLERSFLALAEQGFQPAKVTRIWVCTPKKWEQRTQNFLTSNHAGSSPFFVLTGLACSTQKIEQPLDSTA